MMETISLAGGNQLLVKPEENIPKINLCQKQRVCFVVSNMGEEFFVDIELCPRRNGNRSKKSVNLHTTKPNKQARSHDDLQGQGIDINFSPKEGNFLDVFNTITFSDLKDICFLSIEDDLTERERIRKIADQRETARELIAYHQHWPRNLSEFFDWLRQRYPRHARKIQIENMEPQR